MATFLDSLLEKIKHLKEENSILKDELKNLKNSKKKKKVTNKQTQQETLF
jgi:cell division septum initiation protein DivIVA